MTTTPTPLQAAEHLESLAAALEAARRDLVAVCEKLEVHWELASAFEAWTQAAEALAEGLEKAAAETRDYIAGQSEDWQESAAGQAADAWADELEQTEVETELFEHLRVSIDVSDGEVNVENAEEVVPEGPSLPDLDA
jgi:hypothetical protein